MLLADRLRKYAAYGIAIAPSSKLRVMLLRWLLGYRFGKRAFVGMFTVIAVDRFECGDNVIIGRGNRFIGPISVLIGNGVLFGKYNRTECSFAIRGEKFSHMNYLKTLEVGDDALINQGHIFDLAGRISIGSGSWIAGFDSQFISHGASVMDRNISIGRSCFVGSAVRFAPGSSVGDQVIVGIGSVVTKKMVECNVVVAGVPARILKQRNSSDQFQFSRVWAS